MEPEEKGQAPSPGLKWRARSRGQIPYWIARPEAVAAGFAPKSVNLEPLLASPDLLALKCQRLQQEMQDWMSGKRQQHTTFDGTIGSALTIYETHPESTFRNLKPGSRRPYTTYLRLVREHVGARRVVSVTGLDVRRWHADWSHDGACPAAGKMSAAVLMAALTFCVSAGHRQCQQLRDDIRDLRLPGPRPRTLILTADEVIKARRAAHALGRPSAALCYAIQFETTLRLWDVAGQWYPLSDPFLSTITRRDLKWSGLQWRNIDANLVLRIVPSKTEDKTGAEVVIDLTLCPMVLEEIAAVPPEKRVGPVIVNERTGLPYRGDDLVRFWNEVRTEAGLSPRVWCRDLRSSGITEARAGGVATDDASKVAGHSRPVTTRDVYDRARLEAHQRFAAGRVAKRAGNTAGNA